MIVLSLFDGISGARLALHRAGIPITEYYASEIDKWCIQISRKNWPGIIHLDDIRKWQSWDIPKPDLIIGGSPCQGFSSIGKRLAFKDERSKLIISFFAIIKYFKPKYFILENVKMSNRDRDIISSVLGVEPVLINSALVSAQNRNRYYWCNFPITQPKDKGILLQDIIENGFVDRNKSRCLLSSYTAGAPLSSYFKYHKHQLIFVETRAHGFIKSKHYYDKHPHLTSNTIYDMILKGDLDFRKLTPVECERLQTYPDNYTKGVSNTQRYKMLGNSFTVDAITHILKCMVNSEKGGNYEETHNFERK